MSENTRKASDAAELKEDGIQDSFEDWTQIKRLGEYLKPRSKKIILAVFLSIGLSFLILVPAILTKVIIDQYISEGQTNGIYPLAVLIFVAMVGAFLLESFTQFQIATIGQETMRDLRVSLFEHLQKQSLKFFDKKAVGYLVTRMTSDVNVLNEFFAQGVIGIFQQLFMLAGIIIVLFVYNWQLALWAMIVVPLVLILSKVFRDSIRVSYRLTRSRLSKMNTHVQENVTGMRAVQANTQEKRQYSLFNDLNDRHRDAHQRTVFAYSLYFPLIEIISALGISVVIWKGSQQFVSGFVTFGELFLFVSLLERFFFPVKDLSEKFNLIQSAIAASERLFALLDQKPDIRNIDEPKELPVFNHRIEFKDVWFAYNDKNWILKGINLTIEKGQTVAIVGPTGSGKSTLMSLLCRFYDIQKGSITIDGIDIRDLQIEHLREKIAIVLQDVFLFKGSVSHNISLGNPKIDKSLVRQSAETVSADPFIKRLPRDYDTGVMERGATLSVGQKQLLSFARALAADPSILILDEATSSIDTESESLIQEALTKLTGNRTSLVIAHRLSTIQAADQIVVLKAGHVEEKGKHQELLSQDGLYRKLYELQYKDEVTAFSPSD